jgi:hypothetical protein
VKNWDDWNSDWATGWRVRCSEPTRGKIYIFSKTFVISYQIKRCHILEENNILPYSSIIVYTDLVHDSRNQRARYQSLVQANSWDFTFDPAFDLMRNRQIPISADPSPRIAAGIL